MGSQIERQVEDYFIEEIIGDELTGNLLLVTDARPIKEGKLLITAPDIWTWQEAVRFVKLCVKNGAPPVSMFDDTGPVAQW